MIQLVADNNQLDIDNNEAIQITKSASDVEDFTERQGGFTFNFDLPFTTTNNNFFEHYYEVTQELGNNASFNPYLRTEIQILVDGLEVMRGYLQLNDVKVTSRVYSVTCFDTVGLLREELGDKKLSELSTAFNQKYSHVLSSENIEKSTESQGVELLDATRTTFIKYPFCDYGVGITNEDIAGQTNTPPQDLDMRPWWAVELLFKQILGEAGFTNLDSDFLNSAKFKKVYMLGATKEQGTLTTLIQYRFLTALDGTLESSDMDTSSPVHLFEIDLDFSNGSSLAGQPQFQEPPGTLIDTTNNEIVIPVSGIYSFRFNHNLGTAPGEPFVALGFFNEIGFYQGTGNTVNFTTLWSAKPNPDAVSIGTSANQNGVGSVYLSAGSYKYGYRIIKIMFRNPDNTFPSVFFALEPGSFLQMTDSPSKASGGTVEPRRNLPDMTQIDFIRGIVQQFNLFIEPREDALLIEPYPDYMSKGTTLNWTDKLDLSKEVVIQPTYNFRKKVLSLKYADDKDFYTNYRVEAGGKRRSLGSYWTEDNSEFSEGEEITELPFGAPPFYNTRSVSAQAFNPTYLFQLREDGKFSIGDYLPRLAFIQSRRSNYSPGTFGDLLSTIHLFDTNSESIRTFFYDYCDIIDSETFEDLTFNYRPQANWGAKASIPRGFHDGTTFERKTIPVDSFKLYYERYIREIYGDNAKLVTAYFYLTPIDFATLKFNSLVFVKDAYYRINKVSSYTPTDRATTKVELIKLDPFGQIDRNCAFEVVGFDESGLMLWDTIDNRTTLQCCNREGGVFVPSGEDGLGFCYTQQADIPDLGGGVVLVPPGQEVLTGACCYTDEGGDQCAIVTEDVCEFLEGDFKGLGTDCSECEPDPEPTGACCTDDGSGNIVCNDGLTESECTTFGGTWVEGATCDESPCADQLGACCLPSGICEQLTESECISEGGTWTEGATCGEVECE